MQELLDFLRAALDEDERKVAAMEREETRVRTAPIFQGHPLGRLAGVDIFVSSKRWRAEIEAKRAILDEADGYSPELEHGDNGEWAFETVIKLLAQPYAGQPGWREEWAA